MVLFLGGITAAVMNFGNELKITGTHEFKKHILELIVDNEKYKDIKILNPKLNEELEKMRGSKNLMSEGVVKEQTVENEISKPEEIQKQQEPEKLTDNQFTITSETTVTEVLEHYSKIDDSLIKTAKENGFVTTHEVGFTPKHTPITADAKTLAEELGKITGSPVKIENKLTNDSQNSIMR